MPHGNDVLHSNHFRKHWQSMVKTWFNQPARKERRRAARKAKARKIAPRPASGPLRPIVNCPTLRYNMKVRAGRGFSLQEVRAAGFTPKFARTVGISVDHRRRNVSVEGLQRNIARLKAYKARLILFPKNPAKLQPLEAKADEVKKATQRQGPVLPITQRTKNVKAHKPTTRELKYSAFHAIRQHRANARLYGKRLRARQAAAAAE
ncbi:60S ribosomal protein L13 [Clonorchis sinensis]|uniref:60S ribosomal protein L13 n=3 Tax=Opisthorchiidae TaxID=6196 RepID=A0A8T1LYF4_CLOSI|nr:60S ribosomal protein L13 [Clonorchis sinensis]GAA49202.1 large subunit ribosomal protein L13e [Clonorchis sinensis]